MIVEITEQHYKGFYLKHVPDKGWKIVLKDTEILFPHFTAATSAIDAFYRDVIKTHQGKKLAIPEEIEGKQTMKQALPKEAFVLQVRDDGIYKKCYNCGKDIKIDPAATPVCCPECGASIEKETALKP